MSVRQQEAERDSYEEVGRQDCLDCYCPRKNEKVVLISSRCFYHGRDRDCHGCIFDVDLIYVKLILIMSEILEARP